MDSIELSGKEKRILIKSIRMALREGGYMYKETVSDEELETLLRKLGEDEGKIVDMIKYGW